MSDIQLCNTLTELCRKGKFVLYFVFVYKLVLLLLEKKPSPKRTSLDKIRVLVVFDYRTLFRKYFPSCISILK